MSTTDRPHPDARANLPGRGWLTVLLLFVAAMTLWLLLYPFDFQPRRMSLWLAERRLDQLHKINFASNVLLFLPLGLIAGWRLSLGRRGGIGVMLLALLLAGAISLLGETLQQWLPAESYVRGGDQRYGRTSSLLDLIANIAGAAVAGVVGLRGSRGLSARSARAAAWLAPRPASRRALGVILIVVLARLAPFDLSLESYYLGSSLRYETASSGGPFSATRQWLAQRPSAGGGASERAKAKAMLELRRAAIALGLFLVTAFFIRRAQRENDAIRGPDAGSGAMRALMLCVMLALATEAMHWPIRSRMLDATEPVAGLVAVLLGMALGSLGGNTSRSRRQVPLRDAV